MVNGACTFEFMARGRPCGDSQSEHGSADEATFLYDLGWRAVHPLSQCKGRPGPGRQAVPGKQAMPVEQATPGRQATLDCWPMAFASLNRRRKPPVVLQGAEYGHRRILLPMMERLPGPWSVYSLPGLL